MYVCDIIAIFVLACSILQRKGNIDLLQIHNSLRILCIYNPIVMEIDNHLKFPFYLPQPLCKASIQAETRLTYNCAHLRSTKENCHLDMIYDGTGSLLVGTWCYWVSTERNWFILGGIGTV